MNFAYIKATILATLFGVLFLPLTGAHAQTLVANPNPVILAPGGATEGTSNVIWDGEKEKNARLYWQIDNDKENLFSDKASGNKSATVAVGKTYTFKLYNSISKSKLLKTLVVTAKQQGRVNLPPGGNPAVPVVGISNVSVQASSHNVVVRFDAPANQLPTVEVGKVAPTRLANGLLSLVGGDAVGFLAGGDKAHGHYSYDISVIAKLEPNTGYFYLINAQNSLGKRVQATGKFTTRGQTVKVFWDAIHILNDSDPIGGGELEFCLFANYGLPGAQSRKLGTSETLDLSDGNWYDVKQSMTIPNAIDTLALVVNGADDDSITGYGFLPGGIEKPFPGPYNSTSAEVNVAKREFDLSAYPGDSVRVPFTLRSMNATGGSQGDLMFEVTGYLDISREAIGSSSSQLQTQTDLPIWQTTPFAPPGAGVYATFIYALRPDGTLDWWRHDGAAFGTDKWLGPRKVGEGWNYKQILPGGGNIIYAITNDGKLLWFQHNGFNTGAGLSEPNRARIQIPSPSDSTSIGIGPSIRDHIIPPGGTISPTPQRPRFFPNFAPDSGANATPKVLPVAYKSSVPDWVGPVQIATGWDKYKQVFSGGNGIIYAVTKDNTLLWFRHNGYLSGSADSFEGPKTVARNWTMKHLFSAGDGIIYGIGGPETNGALWRFKNLGQETGTENWMDFGGSPFQKVSEGFADYTKVFSAGTITNGAPIMLRGQVIYALDKDGKLWWRNHIRMDSNGLGRNWQPAKLVNQNWGQYKQMMALIPVWAPAGSGIH